jgi:hypothetical protein
MPKPKLDPLSPLHQFYTTSTVLLYTTEGSLYVKRLLVVDRTLFSWLSALCESFYPGFPALPPNWDDLSRKQQLAKIDVFIQVWLNSLPATAASKLLNKFKQYSDNPKIQRMWTNYYMNTCHAVILTIWNKIPEKQRTTKRFDSLLSGTYALSSKDMTTKKRYAWSGFPNQMLRGFDIEKSPRFNRAGEEISLVEALNAYAYRAIKYNLYSILQEGEDSYAGLRPLGILTNSKTSYGLIEQALISVNLLNIVWHTVSQKYPNRENEGLRREINQEIVNHLSVSIEEQFKRCKILVQLLREYLKLETTPRFVNLLVESDFLEIRNFYQLRLDFIYEKQTPPQMSTIAVIILLKSIGEMVRQYVTQINDSSSTQHIIGDGDNDMTLEDVFIDENISTLIDEVYSEILSDQFVPLYREIHRFCQLPVQSIDSPSPQQMLWLQYGLEMNTIGIGRFLKTRFNLTDNAGSASKGCNQARTALVRSIHKGMSSTEPLNEDAIELVIEVLKKYFPLVRRQILSKVAIQVDITQPAELIDSDRDKYIDITTTNIERMSGLNLSDCICRLEIEKIVDRFLATGT